MSQITLTDAQMDTVDAVDVTDEVKTVSRVDPAKVTAITRRVDNAIREAGSAEIAYGLRCMKGRLSWTESKVWINRLGREQAKQHRRFAAA